MHIQTTLFSTGNGAAATLRKVFGRSGFCVVLCILLLTGNAAFSQKHYSSRYLAKYKETAIELMNETGIPASVILGVAMLESGMGTSKNARLLRNHFGIVGRNNLAKKKGVTYRSKYREYATDVASYEHFVKLLSRKRWFKELQGKPEYKLWLTHMNHTGYSTAGQEWVKRVTNMINRYKLYKLDSEMAYTRTST